MDLRLFHLLNVIIFSCFFAIQCSHSEHLSNVFVLDTSDSDSPQQQNTNTQHGPTSNKTPSIASAHKINTDEETNTRIISDDASALSRRNQHKQTESNGRKLDEDVGELQLHNEYHKHQSSQAQRINQANQTTSRPRASSSTTTVRGSQSVRSNNNNYNNNNNSEGNGPKTQDRLLISITSNDGDDDQGEGKPQQSSQSSGGGSTQSNDELGSSSHSLHQHQHQKRKPSITISIQDANINKQNLGTGASTVIVRPSEDGQGIVIATVNANPIKQNKPLQPPPAPPLVTSDSLSPASSQTGDHEHNHDHEHSHNNDHSNDHNSNNEHQTPYREPVNNPIQAIIEQHNQISASTTRRPSYAGEYGSASVNRPPQQVLVPQDERPARPAVFTEEPSLAGANYGVESSRRPEFVEPSDPVLASGSASSSSSSNPSSSSSTGIQSTKYELNERSCGVSQETKIVGGDEADPDDFMWMAAIVKARPKDGIPRPFCGGSLITRRHILTAAHCLEGLAPRDVLVRLGSYDFDDSTASSLSADYAIDQFRVPGQYSKKTHVADIAIMRLKTPLATSDNYKTVCMPQPRRSYVGALATVTGYGSQSQTFRRAAPKLRQVTVPIWENRKCSTVYKRNLTEAFLCAGYEEGGRDACQGDSGGPLMTEGPEQRMMVVGVVSHGIGCGAPGYPGVYTRTTTYMDWIEKNTRD